VSQTSQSSVNTTASRTPIRVFDAHYEMRTDGYRQPMAVIHWTGRRPDGSWAHVSIKGFRPYFCIPERSLTGETYRQLDSDGRVLDIVPDDDSITDDEMVKVVCHTPYHVPQLREEFASPHEADVTFIERFQVDTGIKQALSVPNGATPPYDVDVVQSADDHEVASMPPRICWYDIEVQQSDTGAAVVSEQGTSEALNPIFSVVAQESTTGKIVAWVLSHPSWDEQDRQDVYAGARRAEESEQTFVDLRLFDEEHRLLDNVCETMHQWQPNVLAGYNSNGFDTPYVVNRCQRLDVSAVQRLSPTGYVNEMHGEGRFLNGDLDGVVCFDLLDAVDKLTYSELDSYALDAVADSQLDEFEKLDVDEQTAWASDPADLIAYNVRDVTLLPRLNEAVGVMG